MKPSEPEPELVSLSRAAAHGFVVSFGGQAIRLLVSVAQVVVLSRLLEPDTFGLFGMTWAFFVLIYNNRDLGISSALVQRLKYTPELANAAFWLSLCLGLVLAGCVGLLAWPLSWAYGEPKVVFVSLKFAPLFLVAAVSSHYQAILRRRMQFVRMNVMLIIAQVVGTGGAIALGSQGAGIDALIFLLFGQEAAFLLMAVLAAEWRPSAPSFHGEARRLLSFGGDLSIYRMLSSFAQGLDHIALGLFWNPAVVGFYNRAQTLFATPRRQLLIPFGHVAPTHLSRLQNDPVAFASATARLFRLFAYVWFVYLALLVAIPDVVLHIVLGQKWVDTAPLVAVLAFVEVGRLHLNLLNVAETQLGRTRSLRYYGLWSSPLLALGFVVGAPFGPKIMAIIVAPIMTFLLLFRLLQIGSDSPLKPALILRALSFPLLLATILAVVFWVSAQSAAPYGVWAQLGAALTGGLLACGAFLIFSSSLREDISFLMKQRGFRRRNASK